MKNSIALIALLFLFGSCKKDVVDNEVTAPSKLSLLTNKQWLYSEIYYNATAHKQGTLAYKRGSTNNSENRDHTRAFFWRDGTFDEVGGLGGAHSKLSWSFSNSDSTQYSIGSGSSSTNVNIIKLDANTFEWYNPVQRMSAVMYSKL